MVPKLIQGIIHTDSRGIVSFVNNFDMIKVVRMYCIIPEFGVIRAWQGHKVEVKWFYAAKGSFIIKTIHIDSPNFITEHSLNEKDYQVLHIAGGHYNGFLATEKGSSLIVFSDADLEASISDDIRQSIDDYPWIN